MGIASSKVPEVIETRVKKLLKRMTLAEKVGQMMLLRGNKEEFRDRIEEWSVGAYFHCSPSVCESLQRSAMKTRLGIPLIFAEDAIHGHCFEDKATVFPTQLGLSCSWDESLLEDVAHVTAKEARSCGIHWTFSPVLCLGRDSRWGRINETFGEDAHLSSILSLAMIRGYQGNDLSDRSSVMACAKHFVGYGETLGGRDSYEATISKRQLMAHFLQPFERAVKETKVATLMAGYHSIDGLPCSANKWLLQDVAKDAWSMDGFVVTDYNNIGALFESQGVASDLKEAAYLGLQAGNDMIMNTPSFFEHAIELVEEGRIKESRIDESVTRILNYKFRLGLFDENAIVNLSQNSNLLGCQEHMEISLEASRKSITLLKNENVLPLATSAKTKLLVVGSSADDRIAQLGDWSLGPNSKQRQLHQDQTVTFLQALKSEAQRSHFTVDYVRGAACVDSSIDEIDIAIAAAEHADYIVACVGDTLDESGEFHDRGNLNLSGKQQALLEAMKATGKKLIVVFIASKPLSISWIKENADALICAFNPGAKGGTAVADVLFGNYNPSGKLSISFPHSAGQLPVYYNKYPGWHSVLSEQLNGEERYIDQPQEPLFSFGFGLSYTEFSYSDLTLHTPLLKITDDSRQKNEAKLVVSVLLSNTGLRKGTEIAQLYVNDLVSSVTTPVMELKDFKRIELEAGQSERLTFELELDSLSIVNTDLERVVEAGEFEVMVGSSSRSQDLLKTRFTVK